MSKAIITLEDMGGGQVNIKLEFDPPVDTETEVEGTPAQYAAMNMMATLKGKEEDE